MSSIAHHNHALSHHDEHEHDQLHAGDFYGMTEAGMAGMSGGRGRTARDDALSAVSDSDLSIHPENLNNDPSFSGAQPARTGAFSGQEKYESNTPGGSSGQTMNKPSMGDKVAGSAQVMMGKMTGNVDKVVDGTMRKREGKAAMQAGKGDQAF